MVDSVGLINKLKDAVFPQLSRNKEIVYWTTELIAAIIMFIFLIGVKSQDYPDAVDGKTFKGVRAATPEESADLLKKIAEAKDADEAFILSTNAFKEHPTHIQNNEYAWITLFYALKHLFYLADSIFMVKNKVSKWYDLIGPLATFIMWLAATLIGFLYSSFQIYGGIGLRRVKDLNERVPNNPAILFTLAATEAAYKKYVKIRGMYIGIFIVAAINLSLWILGLIQKRSSFLTNQAVSTWFNPISLALFSAFIQGITLKTNDYLKDTKTPLRNRDEFEGRFIFPLLYFGAWVGLFVFTPIACFMAFKVRKTCKMTMVAWVLWAVFWIFAFAFTLCMDTLIHEVVKPFGTSIVVSPRTTYLLGAIITLIVGIILGIGLAVIYIMKGFKNKNQNAPPPPADAANTGAAYQ